MTPGTAAATFDDHLSAWQAWQQAPWGRLRYRVVAETLRRTCALLGEGPVRVLDAGGGDGTDAVALALQGHDVTVADFSAELLGLARDAAEAAGAANRLRTVEADLDALPDGLGPYDLVLCHNVLHYRADPLPTIDALLERLAPGGAISLICPNPASDVLVAAVRRLEPAAALAVLEAPTVATQTFGEDVLRVDPDRIAVALAERGIPVVARYGIRVVTDLIADDARKSEPEFYADLERLELALCDREPFVRTARMWQLVGRRV